MTTPQWNRSPADSRAGLARRSFLSLMGASALAAGAAPALAQAAPRPLRRQDEDRITRLLAEMTLADKVGQLFVPYVNGATADADDPRNTDLYGVGSIAEIIERYRVGGVIYFGWSDNLEDPQQVARLSNGIQAAATALPSGVPALVSIDQEEGVVIRLPQPSTQLPGTMALGATGDPLLAELAARITGKELRAVGVNQNYAPLADVNVNALNPVIGVRSFGADPATVAALVEGQVDGFHHAGIASTVKHFPGHGDTEVDSHLGLPVIDHTRAELDEIDLPPFRKAIAAGADAVMTAHIVVPALDPDGMPATLSKPILTDLLRDELGFDGVIVTDSLLMEGVRTIFDDDRVPIEAIKAGADQMLMPPDLGLAIDAVTAAVEDGEISTDRLDASVQRILRMKTARGLFDEPPADVDAVPEILATKAHLLASDRIGNASITVLKNDDALLPVSGTDSVLVTGWGEDAVPTLVDALVAGGVHATGLPAQEPDAAHIAEVAATAADHGVVVVLTQSGVFGITEPQQALVQALVDTGLPVVAAAVRNPYDVVHHADTTAAVVTYSYAEVSLQSLARVLAGTVRPSGTLPVDLPEADGETVRYELGHGLTW
ncbi:MAG: glycoside hydrolase family 3 protein [Propionibacteriaceae bacterium]